MSGWLFSWQGSDGLWSFSILEWPLGRLPTLQEAQKDSLPGLNALKRKLASLPDGYRLGWMNQDTLEPEISQEKSRDQVSIPPPAMVEEVRRFAEAHHVKISGPWTALLFSWQDSEGVWNFSILEGPLGRGPTLQDVHKNCLQGLDQLRQKISSLRAGYELYWGAGQWVLGPKQPKGEKSGQLSIPPPAIMEEVKRFAEARHVEVFGPWAK